MAAQLPRTHCFRERNASMEASFGLFTGKRFDDGAKTVVFRVGGPLRLGDAEEDADEQVVADIGIEFEGEVETEALQPAQFILSEAIAMGCVAGRGQVF